MNPYSYTAGEPHFNLQLKKTTSRCLHYVVDFQTANPTRYEKTNIVRGEYFQPRKASHAPLAILLHGMGDRSVIPCKLLARSLVRQGIACFILYLVFHSSRMPEVIRNRLPALTHDEWFESYQVSVIDVRQVLDWASGRAEINQEQIAAVGISFGAFISAITMGIDKRIRAGVLATGGGNFGKIGWLSKTFSAKMGSSYTEVEYRQAQKRYAQYREQVAEKGFENVAPAQKGFQTDPLTFAPYLRQRPVLMINARWDEIIPREAAIDFWAACGKPAITWLPATHATIWLLYPFIDRKVVRFLKSTFGI
jgi:cephalosporin-C deacetylase-like acetyl esterase